MWLARAGRLIETHFGAAVKKIGDKKDHRSVFTTGAARGDLPPMPFFHDFVKKILRSIAFPSASVIRRRVWYGGVGGGRGA